ncbi:MAG TPA: S8 family serine peptidase [Gemmatimonadaceae bacterium]
MSRSITRSHVIPSLLALSVVASCAERPLEPAMREPIGAARFSVSPSSGRYLVAAKGNWFGDDFAAAVAALGGTVQATHQGAGLAIVSGLSADAAAQLAGTSRVAEVQADDIVALDNPVASVQADASAVSDPGASSVLNPAGAARYVWQWNMRAIGANTAWAAGQLGDPGVTVAIIDSGIDYDAPDLNGLVDLTRSASFSASDNQVRSTFFPTRNAISDFNGHGTNVATQVSSKAVALAGVTSKTTLIGVKVLGQNGSGSVSDILLGVLWAADHGADVANMSLGGDFTKAGNGRLVSLINRVFNYAKQRGMLIVVAAGNDSADLDHNGNVSNSFCDMVHVVCVSAIGASTATGAVDTPSFYTNFGRSAISVAAPGGNADAAHNFAVSPWPWGMDIASWVWSYCSKTLIAGFTATGTPQLTACVAGNRLTGFIGTSQASPHVAGLAALLVAAKGHGQPQQIKQIIQQSADDLGQPGTDPFFGRGRINVVRALGF